MSGSEADDGVSERTASILDAAAALFLRYGFKKTSMDDLARAAGLSRQGLYLHFSSKEALFKAVIEGMAAATSAIRRAELEREGPAIEDRLLAAFVVVHAQMVGPDGGETVAELLATAEVLMGGCIGEMEEEFVGDLAQALRASGVAAAWKAAGVSAKELAANLVFTSHGAKKAAPTPAAYRAAMRTAVRVICRGAPR